MKYEYFYIARTRLFSFEEYYERIIGERIKIFGFSDDFFIHRSCEYPDTFQVSEIKTGCSIGRAGNTKMEAKSEAEWRLCRTGDKNKLRVAIEEKLRERGKAKA